MVETVASLSLIKVPRPVYPSGTPASQQIFAFADVSDIAIAYVIYLRTVTTEDEVHVAFLTGNSRVIPKKAVVRGTLSIPRAELNEADAASQAVLQVENELKGEITLLPTQYFTDSEYVAAWINNRTDSFKGYVTNRRDRICQLTDPSQWHWIPGECNPVDIGTRSISVVKLQASEWISGPKFLQSKDLVFPGGKELSALQTTEQYKQEIRKTTSLFTEDKPSFLKNDIMDGSAWDKMLHNSTSPDPELSLAKDMQERGFPEGLDPLHRQSKLNLPRVYAKLMNKTPFKDEDGIIRCGGRLTRADLSFGRRHHAVIPEGDEEDSLIGYIHANKAVHQGRIITNALIREEGYIAIGGRRRINKLIRGCPDCRILRAKPMQQKMVDLPTQRMEKIPPFQHAGMDVFGPFSVNNGRVTRANTGTRKIWVLLLTCLYSRVIHVETLWSMNVQLAPPSRPEYRRRL